MACPDAVRRAQPPIGEYREVIFAAHNDRGAAFGAAVESVIEMPRRGEARHRCHLIPFRYRASIVEDDELVDDLLVLLNQVVP
jgi:hypothetical protein